MEVPFTYDMKEIIHEKNNRLNFIKIKNFYSVKDIVKRIKRQATDQEKMFVKHMK